MTARGHLRGHPIHWDAKVQAWRYDDTGELTVETWFTRPCGHCGLFGNSSDGDVDPCLGMLPGVTNACCGHGDPSEAYICFQGGLAIRGFYIDRLHQRRMTDAEQAQIDEYNRNIKQYRPEYYGTGHCPDCGDTKAGGPACQGPCGALEPEEVNRRRAQQRRPKL